MTTPLPDVAPAADERTTLVEFLDFYRAVARRKAEGLTDKQLRTMLPGHPSTLSIHGIIRHLGSVETWWSEGCLEGAAVDGLPEPWRTGWQRTDDLDWDFLDERETADELLGWFDLAVATARATYAKHQLDDLSPEPWRPSGSRMSMRWILVHLIEEYARHVGHLDLLRELVDGATGD